MDRQVEIRLAERAKREVSVWRGMMEGNSGETGTPCSFPFREIITYYRSAGRMAADPSLVASLRELPAAASGRDPVLPGWLRMAVDQEDGDYATYFGAELYERHGGGPKDAVIAALVADLVFLEAQVLCSDAGDGRQLTRTKAAVQALAGLRDLAPDHGPRGGPIDAVDLSALLSGNLDDAKFGELAGSAAAVVSAAVPAATRHVVDITLLPTTPMHDEQMFLRIIQVFEILYAHLAQDLTRATALLDQGDIDATCAVLAKADGRLRATRTLFRVLTTMPSEAFSVIRDNTDGRSAIQSRSHRRVELLSAPPPATTAPPSREPAPAEAAGPTLQEAFLRREPLLSGPEAHRLTAALRALDGSWTTAKRTHWGITLKIIGSVPGTGGTSGADYLEAKSQVPLFPFLHSATA
ncbi:hypothetical protein [Streptomyces sp. SPB162]|uniref:hypothetical protein n=1 Tax=Streptomyces sp. SPB162 TaxID=2940560 RepID=UPI002405F7E8|nr:hypothetical protein [Streptomyces sp. SPB162]MDF9815310.1 tryptophan 2,3-dioxygenase [Streptomyces sp. SPB162]